MIFFNSVPNLFTKHSLFSYKATNCDKRNTHISL